MTEVLRHWERIFSQRIQSILSNPQKFMFMKNLKTILVKSMTILSNKEMALINGGITIETLDTCTPDDANKPCLYATHILDGHYAYVTGKCFIKHDYFNGNFVVVDYGCK